MSATSAGPTRTGRPRRSPGSRTESTRTPETSRATVGRSRTAVARDDDSNGSTRASKTHDARSQEIAQEAQTWVREQGMQRSAVILASAVVTMQTQRLSREAGMYALERYLDASSDPDWEAKAVAWVTDGVDPDA